MGHRVGTKEVYRTRQAGWGDWCDHPQIKAPVPGAAVGPGEGRSDSLRGGNVPGGGLRAGLDLACGWAAEAGFWNSLSSTALGSEMPDVYPEGRRWAFLKAAYLDGNSILNCHLCAFLS